MAQKGPGQAYRETISLVDILRKFPDNTTAEAWFAEHRWGDRRACPHCGSERVQSSAADETMPYRCREKECRKRLSDRVGTIMQASNLGYQSRIYLCI